MCGTGLRGTLTEDHAKHVTLMCPWEGHPAPNIELSPGGDSLVRRALSARHPACFPVLEMNTPAGIQAISNINHDVLTAIRHLPESPCWFSLKKEGIPWEYHHIMAFRMGKTYGHVGGAGHPGLAACSGGPGDGFSGNFHDNPPEAYFLWICCLTCGNE